MNPRIAVLNQELTLKRAQLDALDTAAANESRDLTDTERADYDATLTRMEAIGKEIPELTAREERLDKLAATTATVLGRSTHSPARTAPRIERVSMGDELLIRAKHGQNILRGLPASEEWETLQRYSLAHGTSADGTAPVTIEGDLIKFVDANRYVVNAVRRIPMPDNHAPTFLRPRASQFTLVNQQVTQGDVLDSQSFKVTGDTITKASYGGTIALSEQEIDWTDPALLGLTVQDLAQQYAIETDTVLAAAIVSAFNESYETTLSLTAAADVFIAGVATASAEVYTNSKRLPDKLLVSVDRWSYIASLVDGNGRPLFPISGGQIFNDAGQNISGVTSFNGMNVMGLQVVVDPNFVSNTWVVVASDLIEFYEQDKGLLTLAAPSTLETLISYRGYIATNIYDKGLSSLEAS